MNQIASGRSTGQVSSDNTTLEEILTAFCLGEVPVVIETMDGRILQVRMYGLMTEESSGPRDTAETPPKAVISYTATGGERSRLEIGDIKRVHT